MLGKIAFHSYHEFFDFSQSFFALIEVWNGYKSLQVIHAFLDKSSAKVPRNASMQSIGVMGMLTVMITVTSLIVVSFHLLSNYHVLPSTTLSSYLVDYIDSPLFFFIILTNFTTNTFH